MSANYKKNLQTFQFNNPLRKKSKSCLEIIFKPKPLSEEDIVAS